MARLRTAYVRDLDGRLRRGDPERDADIGPAAAAVDGLAALGRLSATAAQEYLQADVAQALGSGAIERRKATLEDLARLTAAPPMYLRPASRPAPRVVPLAEPTRAPAAIAIPSHPEESPVTVTATIAPEESGLPPLPCTTCIHQPVCRLISLIENETDGPFYQGQIVHVITTGLRVLATTYTVECDYYLTAATAETAPLLLVPEPLPAAAPSDAERLAASRQRGNARMLEEKAKATRHPSKAGEAQEKAERAERALAALERWNGDTRKAAAEIGMRPNAFAMVVKHAQARRTAAESQVAS